MLRIKGAEVPPEVPPQSEQPVPEEAQPPMPEEASAPKTTELQKVSPMIAAYKTSDMGPFICSNCHYFQEDGSCAIVDGQIDPEGVCNLFTPMPGQDEPEPEGQPEEVPEEAGVPPEVPPPTGPPQV